MRVAVVQPQSPIVSEYRDSGALPVVTSDAAAFSQRVQALASGEATGPFRFLWQASIKQNTMFLLDSLHVV